MCHAHVTTHKPCQHTRLRLTLCNASLLPLIAKHLASRPNNLPLDIWKYPLASDSNHHVALTATVSLEPCRHCELPDLDIWHLDDTVNIIDNAAKLKLGKRWVIDVEIEGNHDGPLVDKQTDEEEYEMMDAVKMPPVLAGEAKTALGRSDCDACVVVLPSDEGLRLLVMATKWQRRTLRSKL